ncbi:hypothetical protein BLA29_010306 [Euroglyphus maynei]|uniref:Uncharacterized protein n=1 Tax=Euroglyphus maynei TaxID=6958 RepID=A0A1Y3B6L9_EURMA|nr:hypothetical protein BLA29_010306 [Euroglyphus maynei]
MIGLIAIVKEHVPSILIFAVSMIFYLLLLMYSRIFDTAGWIIIRTLILVAIILLTIIYCIIIRDWRQLQLSRLRQRAIKEVRQQQQYGLPLSHYRQSIIDNNNPYHHHHHQYEQIENIYSQIGHSAVHHPPATSVSNRTPGVILTTHYH